MGGYLCAAGLLAETCSLRPQTLLPELGAWEAFQLQRGSKCQQVLAASQPAMEAGESPLGARSWPRTQSQERVVLPPETFSWVSTTASRSSVQTPNYLLWHCAFGHEPAAFAGSLLLHIIVIFLATWIYKVFFLQASWRKAILFGVVPDQYFYLVEDIVSTVSKHRGGKVCAMAWTGTLQHASLPLATVVSNQVYGLFSPSLPLLENYVVADTQQFRTTVAWPYALSYAPSLMSLCALPWIPWQKIDAPRRKRGWNSSPMAGSPALARRVSRVSVNSG